MTGNDARTSIADLIARIRLLESELETELKDDLERKAAAFRYRIERGRVRFDRGTRPGHLALRRGLARYLRESDLATVLTAPIIYAMIVPLVLMDAAMTVYQHACFRVYGIPRVERGRYVVLDRGRLAYLNGIEKLNCEYCGYANGVIAYAREIAARTEQYWCPIKHAQRALGRHARYADFLAYGDAEAWRRDVSALRAAVRGLEG